MTEKPKLEDVAKLAGVSPTTVSRVLNNRGAISDKTRQRVNEAIEQLNYHPNEIARSLFVSKTHFIGLIFPTTGHPFYGEIVFHIENILSEKNYKVLICNTMDQADKETKYLNMLLANQVDGMIVGAHNVGIDTYQRAHLPIVAIDRKVSDTITVISSDNYQGGRIAAEELLRQGRTKTIHINSAPQHEAPSSYQRRKGYEDVLAEHGLPFKTYTVELPFDTETKQQMLSSILDEHPDLDGMFLSDDITAAIALSMVRNRKKDIFIIGYDGTETVTTCLPELTTVVQPIRAMAQLAVDLLLKEINNDFTDIKKNYMLPVKLRRGEQL
ncbi:LacI family DNA-binding transcriptional regulator [Sporolactobacillus shoreicorticis]|uniref:LacI family DNA-binding transcriptional regulator n=1 Tax=Sporolactobacillus shoreicorticis TaxID=1923877 RepID=A0ABW5S4D4_9BACL|nr:LacI family DNA-binding transcriptional regulator [Sporolactobacillus shoreicorticis]